MAHVTRPPASPPSAPPRSGPVPPGVEDRPRRLPLTVAPDIDGPRVRLGVVWFAAVVGAAAVGRLPLALLVGAVAAGAAIQAVRVHDEERLAPARRPRATERVVDLLTDRLGLPAALAAMALPLAAVAGPSTVVAALPAIVVVTLFHRLFTPSYRGPIGDLGSVLVAGSVFGLAAAGVVLAAHVGSAVSVVVLVLVCAYDAGSYLVGSENANRWEGPVAGIAAVVVVTFAAAVVQVPPVDAPVAVALGVLVAVAGPLGPPVAALLMGDVRHRARCVRRIDSLVVVGPLVPWLVALVAS